MLAKSRGAPSEAPLCRSIGAGHWTEGPRTQDPGKLASPPADIRFQSPAVLIHDNAMKLRLSLFFVAAFSFLAPSTRAEDFNILMIGNSYTQGQAGPGGVTNDVLGIFNADPDHTASVTERAQGGYTIVSHLNDATTLNLITDNVANQWDVIVVQEQSTRPAFAMKFGGSNLTSLDTGGPVLIDLIKLHQPQAEVVLYNTWARDLNNSILVNRFNNDPVEMQSFTNLGYDRIRENSPFWDHSDITTIARVGDAWGAWYASFGYGSSVPLHVADGSHQNNRGSMLAGLVIFETITGKSSVGNTFIGSYQGGVTGSAPGTSELLLLQQQATAITMAASPTASLSTGDIAVIGIHGDGSSTSAAGDAFSWVPLVDLEAGETFYFTDVGYFDFKANNNGFGSDSGEEGLLEFTVPSGGIVAGTVQTISQMNAPGLGYSTIPGNAYTSDLTQAWINLSTGGEQVLVFQDDDVAANTANFTPLFQVSSSTTDWSAAIDGDLVDPNNGGTGSESNLAPGLVDGQNAVAVGAGSGSLDEFDNVRYVGPTIGNRNLLLAAISSEGNWEGTNTSQAGGVGAGPWSANFATQFTILPYPDSCNGDGGDQMGCSDCPCMNNAAPGTRGGCLNSVATSARLIASGDASVSLPVGVTDDLRFAVVGAPPMILCVLNSGDAVATTNRANPCFGLDSGVPAAVFDGLRCAVQNTRRHGGRPTDQNGNVGFKNNPWGGESNPFDGIANAGPGFVAGQTRYFQIVHRDDPMSSCMRALNTSQAVEVVFVP